VESAPPMDVFESQLRTDDPRFQANVAHHRQLAAELKDKLARARQGGGEKAQARHKEQGKLFVRDRIDRLLDPGAPFLEMQAPAGAGMSGDEAPSAAIVTGVGRVAGRECLMVANDATVKGGTSLPITVKKHLRAQEIAEQNRLACIYLVDSGGAFLPLQ